MADIFEEAKLISLGVKRSINVTAIVMKCAVKFVNEIVAFMDPLTPKGH